MSSWFVANDVRLDWKGAVAYESLSATSAGPHLVVVGAPSVMGSVLAGVLPIARGTLTISGKSPRDALLGGEVAAALLDPRTPDGFTPRGLAMWSARLAGHGRRDARERAADALGKLELGACSNQPLAGLPLAAKRAAVLAGALATGATTLIVEDPLVGLADDASRALGRIAALALDDRSWILLASSLSLASPLGLRADDAVVLGSEGILAQGAPAEVAAMNRVYSLTLSGAPEAFAERLRSEGATAAVQARSVHVELPSGMTTHDLFAFASDVDTTILALRSVTARVS